MSTEATPAKRRVKLTFTLEVDLDLVADDGDMAEYGGLFPCIENLYEQEGHFWSENLKLVGAEEVAIPEEEK